MSALESAAAAWFAFMTERALDGVVALAVVLPIVAFVRRRAPHFRAALLLLALLPLIVPVPALPLRTAAFPSLRHVVADRLAPQTGAPRSDAAADGSAHDSPAPTAATTSGGDPAADVRRAPPPVALGVRSVLFVAWLAVVIALLARWLVQELRLRRALRAGRPLTLPELEAVRAVESDALCAPATTGWARPTIVLPTALRHSLAPDELRFVLLHELAHVRRGDLWTGALERLIRIAWFFHPAPWIVGRLLDDARESACDDAALSRFPRGERRACAAAFLKVVELAGAGRPRFTVAAALSRDGRSVRSRIMRMVEAGRTVRGRLSRSAWLALAASAAALLLVLQPARVAEAVAPSVRAARTDDDARLQAAAQRAGEWLVKHQDPAGYWSASGFGQKCGCEGAGGKLNDVGVTGLALLALTGEWRADPSPRVAAAIERAAGYLRSIQDPDDGFFGPKQGQHYMYAHALATLALAELQAAAPTDARAATLRRAVGAIARSRNPYKGWRYNVLPDGDNDASVTGAMLLALGRAMEAGVPVDAKAVDDGLHYLDEMTDPATGRTGYHERGSLSAREPEDMACWPAERSEAITAVALHVRVAHDEAFGARPLMQRGAALLAAKHPTWSTADGAIDFYYWFHATSALRAAGGPAWREWRAAVMSALLDHQETQGHAAGSFDPGVDPWGDNGGRVYSTAINLLTLLAATGG